MSNRKFIQLTDDEHEELKSKLDGIQAKKDLVDELADRLQNEKMSMWSLIFELYPEVEGKSATFHAQVGKISYSPDGLSDDEKAAQNMEQWRIIRKLRKSDTIDDETMTSILGVLNKDD